jgi:hypothetical protein
MTDGIVASVKKSGVFETAFSVLACLLFPNEKTLSCSKKAIYWLINHQQDDRSWPTAPTLRVPLHNGIHNPTKSIKYQNEMLQEIIIENKRRVFTFSAAILSVLTFNFMR